MTYESQLTLLKDEWLELLETLEKVIPLDDYATIPGGGESEFSYRQRTNVRSSRSMSVYKERDKGVVMVVIDPECALSSPFDKVRIPVEEAKNLIVTMRKYLNQ